MTEKRLQFYKTVFHFEVLSNSPIGDVDLDKLYEATYDGDCSGRLVYVDQSELTRAGMIEHCELHSSDPEFFGIEPLDDCPPWEAAAVTEMESIMEGADYKEGFVTINLGQDNEGEVIMECGTIDELLEHLTNAMLAEWNAKVEEEANKPKPVLTGSFVIEQLMARYGSVLDKKLGTEWGDDLAMYQAIEQGADRDA